MSEIIGCTKLLGSAINLGWSSAKKSRGPATISHLPYCRVHVGVCLRNKSDSANRKGCMGGDIGSTCVNICQFGSSVCHIKL